MMRNKIIQTNFQKQKSPKQRTKNMEASQILQGIVWGVLLASTCGFSLAYGIHLMEERQFKKNLQQYNKKSK